MYWESWEPGGRSLLIRVPRKGLTVGEEALGLPRGNEQFKRAEVREVFQAGGQMRKDKVNPVREKQCLEGTL